MSNNPQWKMFQPPETHSSTLHDILDLQPSNMQAKQAYRNGECMYHYIVIKMTTFIYHYSWSKCLRALIIQVCPDAFYQF